MSSLLSKEEKKPHDSHNGLRVAGRKTHTSGPITLEILEEDLVSEIPLSEGLSLPKPPPPPST